MSFWEYYSLNSSTKSVRCETLLKNHAWQAQSYNIVSFDLELAILCWYDDIFKLAIWKVVEISKHTDVQYAYAREKKTNS